jgi:hypothetical protein
MSIEAKLSQIEYKIRMMQVEQSLSRAQQVAREIEALLYELRKEIYMSEPVSKHIT